MNSRPASSVRSISIDREENVTPSVPNSYLDNFDKFSSFLTAPPPEFTLPPPPMHFLVPRSPPPPPKEKEEEKEEGAGKALE